MRIRSLTIATAALALVAGAACAPPAEHSDPVIIGDSITVSLTRSGYGPWFGPTQLVDAVIGRAIPSGGLDAVRAAVPHTIAGDKFVIELGTNDVGWHPGDDVWYRQQIVSVLDAIPADRCVAWVLPYRRDGWTMQSSTILWGNIVTDELWKRRRCFAIIDWYHVADANFGFVLGDGIHLSSLGNEALAHLIVDALNTMVMPPVLIPPVSVTSDTTVPTTQVVIGTGTL